MTEQHGAGGNGKSNKARGDASDSFDALVHEYLDGFVDEDTEEQSVQIDQDDQDEQEDLDTDLEVDKKSTISYYGQQRTTTGIVKIMRANGNTESADLLEELRQTQESARQLLDQLRDLHHHKTGTYPRPNTKPRTQSEP